MALNIIFMGTPKFCLPILNAIKKSEHNIIGIYTQPPKKKDRGQKIDLTPVHKFAIENSINIRHPENLDTNEEINFFKKKKPDVILVVAYGKIIPSKLLEIENTLFLNIHASLLPKWRGAAPIQRSIMNLDRETGVSIMKIIPKLDAGPVMMKSKVKISKDTNFEDLTLQLSEISSKLILQSLDRVEKGSVKFDKQDESKISYAKKITKKETKIIWSQKAKFIIAKINALSPTPGAWFSLKGSRIKVIKAVEVKGSGNPGEIIDSKFVIACSENAIQILELQKAGKRKMIISEFLKGNTLNVGFNVQ